MNVSPPVLWIGRPIISHTRAIGRLPYHGHGLRLERKRSFLPGNEGLMGILEFFFGSEGPATVSLRPGRAWTVDVVGESNFQSALRAFYHERGGSGSDLECDAALVPEDGNLHDRNAICVMIAGDVVGYLPPDMAKEYRSRIAELPHLAGPASCSAKIISGHEPPVGETAHLVVKLNISWRPRLI